MRTTRAIISKKNLLHNFSELKKISSEAEIIAIVKANAYGNGMIECSKILEEAGAKFFGVAFPEEGIILRENGINNDIFVLIPEVSDDFEEIIDYNMQHAVSTIHSALKLESSARKKNKIAKAHLFIDTGMNRDGLKPNQALEFMNQISKSDNISIIGICTHFATSDSHDKSFIEYQYNLFVKTIELLKRNGFSFEYIHAANSAAITNYPDSIFNMIRPGLALYGYSLLGGMNLKPVMNLKSSVRAVYHLQKGDCAGYSKKFIASESTNIAVVPLGYGDGLQYASANKIECIIKNKKYPVVGSICMDQCFVDLGLDNIGPGEEVIFIGKHITQSIYADDIAKQSGTIPYEVLTNISARVPRIIGE